MKLIRKIFLFVTALSVSVSLLGCNTNVQIEDEYSPEEMQQLSDKLWERIKALNIEGSIEVTVDFEHQKLRMESNRISRKDKKALKDEFGKVLKIKVNRFWSSNPT